MGVNYADARAAVESIALITASDRNHLLYNSLTDIPSEILHAELKKRGDNRSGLLRENPTTAEIVKIG